MRVVILLALLAMVCVSCEKDIHEASVKPAPTASAAIFAHPSCS